MARTRAPPESREIDFVAFSGFSDRRCASPEWPRRIFRRPA